MKKVVITGGAGFIGSHLAEELARQDYHVIILDDLSTGKMENIAELLKKDNVDFIQGSITRPSLLNRIFENVQYVFHLAAIPSVPRSIENPQASHEVNVNGTLKVLLAARENSVKKVIYASSSSVYGDTLTLPKSEDMIPRPPSPYAVTKLTGEYYCQVFTEVYKLPTVCLRYFNVYGARQDSKSRYASVIPTFIRRVSEGKPPVIFGDGDQTRDFTFVKDAVAATILAAGGNAQGIFNIARGESITINQLARLVIELIGNNVNLVYKEPRPGDIRHSLADICRARALGFEPKYNLKDGLSETIRWLHDG